MKGDQSSSAMPEKVITALFASLPKGYKAAGTISGTSINVGRIHKTGK